MEKGTIADYILSSLKQAQVDTIFGVPGDFMLHFLDKVVEHGIKYVGTCNELNAAYAADAYSRIKGIGVVAVTWGVGELSALNGIAGAFAEHVPVVVLVGSPPCEMVEKDRLVHHRLGPFNTTQKIFENITGYAATLDNPSTAPKSIDEALFHCKKYRTPVYLSIPSDMVDQICTFDPKSEAQLCAPWKTDAFWTTEEATLAEFKSQFCDAFKKSSNPVIIVDTDVTKFHIQKHLLSFIEHSQVKFCSTLLGKCVIDETHPNFLGVYAGQLSNKSLANHFVENVSDLVIWVGPFLTDVNTGGFSVNIQESKIVYLQPSMATLFGKKFSGIFFGRAISELAKDVVRKEYDQKINQTIQGAKQQSLFETRLLSKISLSEKVLETHTTPGDSRLDWQYLFHNIIQQIPSHSTFIVDTGVSMFNVAQMTFPSDTIFISQGYYESIGYSIGAAVGAAFADPLRHVTVIVGDGSFQQTFQEISTMIRENLKISIFVINNQGYTIERVINDNIYNDIQNWNYSKTLKYFGGKELSKNEFQVKNRSELAHALGVIKQGSVNEKEEKMNKNLVLIEACLDKMDCCDIAKENGKIVAKSFHMKPPSKVASN